MGLTFAMKVLGRIAGHEVKTGEIVFVEPDLVLTHDNSSAIIDKFEGGPVGLDTLAAAVGEERDTIEDVYEPFLIQEGFLARTPRGRVATTLAYRHFGREQGARVAPAQGRLL